MWATYWMVLWKWSRAHLLGPTLYIWMYRSCIWFYEKYRMRAYWPSHIGPDNFPNFLPTWFSKSSEISSKNKRAFILNYLHLIINSITTGHHYRNLARLDIFNILMTSFDSNFFEVEQRMEILGWILAGVKSNSYVRMRLEKDSKIFDWLRIVRLRSSTEFKKLIDDSEILK